MALIDFLCKDDYSFSAADFFKEVRNGSRRKVLDGDPPSYTPQVLLADYRKILAANPSNQTSVASRKAHALKILVQQVWTGEEKWFGSFM